MGVRNFSLYKVTDHARERVQNRFNITKNEMDSWMTRLLSQSVFVAKQSNRREKYRLNDIVVIVDTHQKHVITVYSENEHDDNLISAPTNPEIKSAINEALDVLIKQKKVKTAIKISQSLERMYEANQRMISPYTNYRYTDQAWDDFMMSFNNLKRMVETGMSVIAEAKDKIQEA